MMELHDFLNDSSVVHLPLTDKTSFYYAKIYKQLRIKGKPIPTNDIWIASSVMEYNLTLYTNDSHFNYIEELTVFDNR